MPFATVLVFLATMFAAAPPSWQAWQHLAGVFDLAGPRGDGKLVAAGAGQLFLVSPGGSITPFANGPHGYHTTAGPEAYLALSPGLHVAGTGCSFATDDVFVLRPNAPLGITRVDRDGHASNFVTVSGLDSLNGIVFDTVGRFDHRLLVTGPHNGHSTVLAIDCRGGIVPISDVAPPVEGGLSIAPGGFGAAGGDLIAPDENSGAIWAITATGHSQLLAQSGIAHGGDIGVESEGFVPPGFIAGGGLAYVADRATPNNPHPGTDTILQMPSSDLAAAGVADGDLLIAAEGGAVTIDVRCSTTCRATTIVPTPTTAHVEGHLLLLANAPGPAASLPAVADLGSQRAQQLLRIVAGALIAATVLILATRRVRRSGRR